MDKSLILSI